jgi:hypothetical protein
MRHVLKRKSISRKHMLQAEMETIRKNGAAEFTHSISFLSNTQAQKMA